METSYRRGSWALAAAALLLTVAGGASAQANATAEPAAVPAAAVDAAPSQQPAPALPPAQKQEAQRPKVFTWASFGTTFAYGQTYGSANVGAGVLLQRGIAPNVELGYAFGNSPTLWSLRPGVTWYVPMGNVRPYVGAYYTHWFVGDGRPDQDGIGARLGLSLGQVMSVGVTYDRAFNCSQNCDSWTPTISAGLSL